MHTPEEPRRIDRGVVAFLDVLGTKGVPSGQPAVEYAKQLLAFREFSDREVHGTVGLIRSFFAVMTDNPSLAEESVDHFSDSLYLWVPIDPGREFEAVDEIARVLIHLFHYGLAHQLPLRGAVSIGPFVAGKGVFVGAAVAEAVEWERVAQWSGVLFAPSATSPVIRTAADPSQRARLTNFAWANVPTRDFTIASGARLLALAWPRYPPDDLRDRIERLYLSNPLPLDVSAKYLNTQIFLDDVREPEEGDDVPGPSEAEKAIVRLIWGDRGSTAGTPGTNGAAGLADVHIGGVR